ncbi:peptidoglycan-binding domain-containing protein [Stappia indica]|uniref:peptidoglycan-binding domain-containing protein n=1 Tax=Stappia indica TaxID=538381 RepID=UPI001CD461A7|nr:peptidoglycan-binding domain-containing protein [Stappia indica]MCA1297049.1 peptidoglycan-binding protein [Stappia indica]
MVEGGECVRRDSQVCSFPFVYSASQGRCVCAEGYRPYGAGCAPERPRPAPQDNITWIQSCLNAAGYDAGTVDGLAGRRTRSAWEEFRAAAGLGEAKVPYTDPETLAALFKACQPEEAGTPPADGDAEASQPDDSEGPAPAEDADDASGPAQTPAEPTGLADFAPDRAQCATGKLYTLLTAQGASVEPCGRACIPPPEGLDDAQLQERAEAQGITWCQSCISVGSLGLLCPEPEAPSEAEAGEAPAAQ